MRMCTLLLGLMPLAACTLTPTTAAMPTPVPAVYAEAGEWIAAEPADAAPKGPWWTRFDDPALNLLQGQLTEGSLSLKIALARLEAAQATAQAATGALWPKITAGVTGLRAETSAHAPSYSALRPNPADDFTAGGSLSYEIDLFGRVRASARSAQALEAAAAGDLASLELALRAELTNDYFQLRAIDAEVEVLTHTLADDQKAFDITDRLYRGGAVPSSDVSQSRSQLENAQTQLSTARLRRAQTEHALAVLLGHNPSEWHLPYAPLPPTVSLPPVAPGQPSTLLQRRPDVAAAVRRVESANAAVGIARSAYFPVFTIGAALGRESTQSATWFEAPARFWSVAPSALVTLIDGGQRRAQVRGAKAALEEATDNYHRTVLSAYQDVEDSLAGVRELSDAQHSAERNAEAAHSTWTQAMHRYSAGATTYLEVAAAQNALLVARLNAISLEQGRIAATTQLVRALGGDWH